MKILIRARVWNRELSNKFGEQYSIHELDSVEELLKISEEFGRFEAFFDVLKEIWEIDFQNDYD